MPGGILDANTVDWQGDELGALAAHAMQEVGGMTYVAFADVADGWCFFICTRFSSKKGLMVR